jgi:hypothetical protein
MNEIRYPICHVHLMLLRQRTAEQVCSLWDVPAGVGNPKYFHLSPGLLHNIPKNFKIAKCIAV